MPAENKLFKDQNQAETLYEEKWLEIVLTVGVCLPTCVSISRLRGLLPNRMEQAIRLCFACRRKSVPDSKERTQQLWGASVE